MIQMTPATVDHSVLLARSATERPAQAADEGERVGPGDLGQVGHDDDVGGDDAPAAHPADQRAERARCPGEGGAAVRLGLVQLLVGDRDHAHRDEGQQDDRRGLDAGKQRAAARDDQAQAGRQGVGGRRGRHPDDDAGDQPQRTALETFAFNSRRGLELQLTFGHGISCLNAVRTAEGRPRLNETRLRFQWWMRAVTTELSPCELIGNRIGGQGRPCSRIHAFGDPLTSGCVSLPRLPRESGSSHRSRTPAR